MLLSQIRSRSLMATSELGSSRNCHSNAPHLRREVKTNHYTMEPSKRLKMVGQEIKVASHPWIRHKTTMLSKQFWEHQIQALSSTTSSWRKRPLKIKVCRKRSILRSHLTKARACQLLKRLRSSSLIAKRKNCMLLITLLTSYKRRTLRLWSLSRKFQAKKHSIQSNL